MILDLKHYQVDLPYPPLKNVRPDKQLAAKLAEGYSGERSELTTVMQYAYHSLQCKRRYAEISQIIKGVSYVETIHLELLGECVGRLGLDTKYTLSLKEKSIPWQANVVEYYSTSPGKMLQADIRGEEYAANFYEEMARTINQPDIAALMARLAKDERMHIQIFTDLYKKHFRR